MLIVKQKIDINAKKMKESAFLHSSNSRAYISKISQLEKKIEVLIEENISLKIKIESCKAVSFIC